MSITQQTLTGADLRSAAPHIRRVQLPDGLWIFVYSGYATEAFIYLLTISAQTGYATLAVPLQYQLTVGL